MWRERSLPSLPVGYTGDLIWDPEPIVHRCLTIVSDGMGHEVTHPTSILDCKGTLQGDHANSGRLPL